MASHPDAPQPHPAFAARRAAVQAAQQASAVPPAAPQAPSATTQPQAAASQPPARRSAPQPGPLTRRLQAELAGPEAAELRAEFDRRLAEQLVFWGPQDEVQDLIVDQIIDHMWRLKLRHREWRQKLDAPLPPLEGTARQRIAQMRDAGMLPSLEEERLGRNLSTLFRQMGKLRGVPYGRHG